MIKHAVIKTGGKQYLVKEGDQIVVDRIGDEKKIELETLAVFNDQGKELQLGKPRLEKKVQAEIVENLKGDKIRIAKFKAKVRYRKTQGFRPQLSKVKIVKI
jgi:large subunit ribosomal protein L21